MPPLIFNAPTGKGLLIMQAHPAGVQAILDQQLATAQAAFPSPLPEAEGKTALILGNTSLGYGSSTAVALKAAGFSDIVGVGFESAPQLKGDKVRRSSTGWYLTHGLHQAYGERIQTYLANAFADETRERIIGDLQAAGRKIDLVLYSVAAPNRSYGDHTWRSALKVYGEPLDLFDLKVDLKTGDGELVRKTLAPASDLEMETTRRVMGGEDLALWVSQMLYGGVLNEGATVTALSYIGPEFAPLRRIYWDGALGEAKKDIDVATARMNYLLSQQLGGKALSVMAPAVVTTASGAIPGVMTYVALFLAASARGLDGGQYLNPIDIGVNLTRALYGPDSPWQQQLDEQGRLRLDTLENAQATQDVIQPAWNALGEGPATGLAAEGARLFAKHYRNLFGWDVDGVDYEAPAEFDMALTPAMGVHDLINAETAAAPTGNTRVDAYFGAKFAKEIPGLEREGGTLKLKTATSREQSAFLADVTGNRTAHEAGVMASSIEFAEALQMLFADIQPELQELEIKSVIHAKEVLYFLGPVPLDQEERVRRLKRRTGKRGMFVSNRIATDENGEILTAGETTLFIGADLSEAAEAKTPDLSTLGEKVGEEPLISRMIDWFVQASGDDNIVHTSRLAAQEMGLQNRVAHGMLVFNLADKWLQTARPNLDPARPRKMTIKFESFVYPEDTLSFYVQDTEKGQRVSVLKDRGEEAPQLVIELNVEDLNPEQIQKIREQKTKQVAPAV